MGLHVSKSDILCPQIVDLAKILQAGKANSYTEFVSIPVKAKCCHIQGERVLPPSLWSPQGMALYWDSESVSVVDSRSAVPAALSSGERELMLVDACTASMSVTVAPTFTGLRQWTRIMAAKDKGWLTASCPSG